MKQLEIEPLENLVLSRSPIASPDTFGLHRTLPIPLPSTVAGLLGSILGIRLESSDTWLYGLDALLKSLERSGCREPILRGPLAMVKIGGKEIYEPYISVDNYLLPPSLIKAEKRDHYIMLDSSDIVEALQERRVGVMLKRGYERHVSKTIYPGYMYRYAATIYRSSEGEIASIKIVYLLNCDINDRENVSRVGGEGRKAIVRIRSLDGRFREFTEKIKSPREAGQGLYIALSPIPLIPGKDDLWLSSDTYGVEFIERIIGVPQREAKGDEPPKRRVEKLSLGYSEALKIRRPQILCLPPGTIVKTKKIERETHRLIEILWNLGYASLYRLE